MMCLFICFYSMNTTASTEGSRPHLLFEKVVVVVVGSRTPPPNFFSVPTSVLIGSTSRWASPLFSTHPISSPGRTGTAWLQNPTLG